MNERIIYLGDFNNKNRNRLKDRVIDKLKKNQGDKFYYLLPNGELLKKYRMEFIKSVKSTFELNIFTFDDIVDEILRYEQIETIDNPMKNIIIRNIILDLYNDNKLEYYKEQYDMEGFIHSVNDIIGEIKRSLIRPDEYLKKAGDSPKYNEIGHIYKGYEKALEKYKLSDREGDYLKSIEILKNTGLLEDLEFIIIDEFYDFRPIEMAILKELIKNNTDIYINMPFNMKKENSIMNNQIEELKQIGFSVEIVESKDRNKFEELSYSLFSGEDKDIDGKGINIINSPTPYLEMKRIFQEIKRLNLNGYKLEDIGLVITSSEYEEYLYRIAEEEKIPISIDKTDSLRQEAIIKEIFIILENKISNGEKFDLINRIKSNYFRLFNKSIREEYELFLRRENFQKISDIEDLLNSNRELNMSKEFISELSSLIDMINKEMDDIAVYGSIDKFNRSILDIIDRYRLMDNIIDRYKRNEDEELFLRDLRSLDEFKNILNNMENEYIRKDNINLNDYYFILEQYLEDEEIILRPGNSKGVHILNPVNSRGLDKKIIFITGLSQGEYPSLRDKGYFLNDYNLKDLNNIGIDMNSYIERMDNESLKFVSIIAQIKDGLYLSRSTGYDGTKIQSIYLDELLELIDKESINHIDIDIKNIIKDDLLDITNDSELLEYFLKKSNENQTMDKNIYRYLDGLNPDNIDKILDKNIGEYYRENNILNKYSGVIKDKDIIKDINSNLNKEYSISNLENYSRCPYFYLLNNIMEIEEMEREYDDYNPMDIGNIYHELLRRYYSKYGESIRESIIKSERFNINKTLDFIRDNTIELGNKADLYMDIKEDMLILEDMINNLIEYIILDIERMENWRTSPDELEFEFGYKREFLIKDRDKTVSMIGKIDRIDKFIEEDKFIITDYKSSGYGEKMIDDMYSGLSLQLPVYIISQDDKNIVAAGYGIIRDKKLNLRLGLVEETSIIDRRNKGGIDREEWDELMDITKENIIDIVKNIESGNFKIEPLDCSEYCIYKNICRYEEIIEI